MSIFENKMLFSSQTSLGGFVCFKVQRGKVLKYTEGIREWTAVCSSNFMMGNLHCGENDTALWWGQ